MEPEAAVVSESRVYNSYTMQMEMAQNSQAGVELLYKRNWQSFQRALGTGQGLFQRS